MFQLNDGRVVDSSTSFEYPAGVLRPPGWIANLSASEKTALGITDWTPPAYVEPHHTLAEQKANAIDNAKRTANNLLTPTDWMVIRKAETSEEVPADWETFRTLVRSYCNVLEDKINHCGSEKKLNAVLAEVEWPLDPIQQAAADKAELAAKKAGGGA